MDSFYLTIHLIFGVNLLWCLVMCETSGDPAECFPFPLCALGRPRRACWVFHCLPDQREPWVGERQPAFTIKLH